MRVLAVTLLFFFLSMGCGEDKTSLPEDSIIGNWLIDKAMRDGRLTETLTDGFIHFQEGNKLVSNLDGGIMTFDYTIENNVLSQRGAVDVDYKIEGIKADTMILSCIIQDYYFKYRMVRDTAQLIVEENAPLEL